MCGITALSRSPHSCIADAAAFMQHATIAIESRGRHATGIAWADNSGYPWYWKEQGSASRTVSAAPTDPDAIVAIGHTRYATLGDPSNNVENHPVLGAGLALVHNGRVENHDDVFASLPDVERVGTVDSESLAALLANRDALGHRTIADALSVVHGVAAIAWLDSDDPNVLHLARLAVRPLTLGWTAAGDLVMSSTPATLADTARRSGVDITSIREVDEGTYLRVEHGVITAEISFEVHPPATPVPDDRPNTLGTRARPHRHLRLAPSPHYDDLVDVFDLEPLDPFDDPDDEFLAWLEDNDELTTWARRRVLTNR